MSRIVVTNKGRLLQNELLKEGQNDSFILQQRDTAPYESFLEPSTYRVSPRSQTIKKKEPEVLHVLTINENIKKELEPLEEESYTSRTDLSMQYANSKFLQEKIAKINNNLNKNLLTPKGGEYIGITLPHIPTSNILKNESSRYRNSSAAIDHNTSAFSVKTSLQGSDMVDKFGVNHYNKLLHYESSINRLVERHIHNEKQALKTAKKVLENYGKRVYDLTNQNLKPPEFLDGLKEKNPEAVEVLMRNTNFKFRKEKRINHYYQQKYEPYQSRYRSMETKRYAEQIQSIRQRKGEV